MLPRARIPESSCSSAALQHSPCSFAPGPDAHEKIRKTISPLSLLFLSCQPRPYVRHLPPAPRRVLWLLQCSTYTMTWPLPSSRPLLKDLSTAACSISNSIRFQLEHLLHLLMAGGSPLHAIPNTSFFYTRQKRGRILPRNCHLASDVSLTCNHSSCHTLPSTSTTFDSKFSNHGVASAAHKPTHIMTVRVAAFPPNSTWLFESSVTRVDFSSSLFLVVMFMPCVPGKTHFPSPVDPSSCYQRIFPSVYHPLPSASHPEIPVVIMCP